MDLDDLIPFKLLLNTIEKDIQLISDKINNLHNNLHNKLYENQVELILIPNISLEFMGFSKGDTLEMFLEKLDNYILNNDLDYDTMKIIPTPELAKVLEITCKVVSYEYILSRLPLIIHNI